jgi:hypothetical protein
MTLPLHATRRTLRPPQPMNLSQSTPLQTFSCFVFMCMHYSTQSFGPSSSNATIGLPGCCSFNLANTNARHVLPGKFNTQQGNPSTSSRVRQPCVQLSDRSCSGRPIIVLQFLIREDVPGEFHDTCSPKVGFRDLNPINIYLHELSLLRCYEE